MVRFLVFALSLFFASSLAAQEDYQQYLDLSYEELDSIASYHYLQGTFEKAIPAMQAGRMKARQEFGEQDSMFAEYTAYLGRFYKKAGDYDKALALYIQGKDIRAKVFGKEHPKFAYALSDLASLHQEMDNYDKALPLLIQAVTIREKDYSQAVRIHGKAPRKKRQYLASALNNLAGLHSDLGNYDKALPLYIRSKNIIGEVLGKEHFHFANALNNLAFIYERLDNQEKALSLHIQAKNIFRETFGEENLYFALSLNHIANLHTQMGNYGKALPLFTQAKNIRENMLGMKHPVFIESLLAMAAYYQKIGSYNKAWSFLGQAMNSSSGIALMHDFDKAWRDSLQQASYASNEHLNKMLLSLKHAYDWLQQDSSIQNATAKQMVVADLATGLLSKLRRQVSNEKDKLRTLGQRNEWLHRYLKLLDPEQDKQKGFELSDQNKSVLLYQATKSEVAYRLGNLPDSLVRQNKEMLQKKKQLQAQLLEKKEEAVKNKLRDELIDINEDLDAFEALVKEAYPKYYQLKYQEATTDLNAIQASLDAQTALIEYAIADSVVHIFCVTKAEVTWEKVLVGKEQLSTYIQQLHGGLSNYRGLIGNPEQAYRQYTKPAYWFYEKLLAPVLKDKKQFNKLIIVTDGELGHLPFETFLTEKAPEQLTPYENLSYVLNDYHISYNYSASLWKENKEAPAPENNGQILALAANYSAPIDSSMQNRRSYRAQSIRQRLAPLPAAREEVEALAAVYSGFFAFDSLASERVVKEKAPDFAVLHFATHGLLDEKRPILSSLAFTEDNDSTEDNFWQAYEISKMELNAELVVLSACETGYGKFQTGNGIASLARSFMYAGAPSLIVSLWQVSDEATSKIMQQLYQNLAKGQAIDEALRQAKLEYIQSAKGVMAHPAFWSPFIQMGKTEPVEIQTKGGWLSWVLGGFGVVILLGLGVGLIRRQKEV